MTTLSTTGELKDVKIDPSDAHLLDLYHWRVNAQGYVCRRVKSAGKERCFYLHREIMRAPKGLVVDHINHDKLDNRRMNLRLVTPSDNNTNRRGAAADNETSGLLGVSWCRRRGKWRAAGTKHGRFFHLGYFKEIASAAEAANRWRNDILSHIQERTT